MTLAVTVPVFLVSGLLLAGTIRSLVRTIRSSVVVAFPVAPVTRFTLPGPGSYVLYGEGRFGSRDVAGVQFDLSDGNGRPLSVEAVLVRLKVSSMSRVRVQLRAFTAAVAGEHTLRVSGIPAGSDPGNRVVIGRPVQPAMILHILGIIALAALTIGALVASGLAVAKR